MWHILNPCPRVCESRIIHNCNYPYYKCWQKLTTYIQWQGWRVSLDWLWQIGIKFLKVIVRCGQFIWQRWLWCGFAAVINVQRDLVGDVEMGDVMFDIGMLDHVLMVWESSATSKILSLEFMGIIFLLEISTLKDDIILELCARARMCVKII